MKTARTADILGTRYEIIVKKYTEEESFERRHIVGFCDGYAKQIVVCDMATHKGWEHECTETLVPYQKCVLRHEIVHAFLFESGLAQNSGDTEAWASNEEMVDWIARQGPKIYKAWQDAGVVPNAER